MTNWVYIPNPVKLYHGNTTLWHKVTCRTVPFAHNMLIDRILQRFIRCIILIQVWLCNPLSYTIVYLAGRHSGWVAAGRRRSGPSGRLPARSVGGSVGWLSSGSPGVGVGVRFGRLAGCAVAPAVGEVAGGPVFWLVIQSAGWVNCWKGARLRWLGSGRAIGRVLGC
jgi:hypothetical protein